MFHEIFLKHSQEDMLMANNSHQFNVPLFIAGCLKRKEQKNGVNGIK